MRTIWQYCLDEYLFDEKGQATTRPVIPMPAGARVLCVQMQNNRPCIWAGVNTDDDLEPRTFQIVGIGNPMPMSENEVLRYVGTYQTSDDYYSGFVFHLFEVEERY